MKPCIASTPTATWVLIAPGPGDDPIPHLAERLAGLAHPTGVRHLAGELVRRTVESARRARAGGDDVGAALLTAVLDAIGAASARPAAAPGPRRRLLRHLSRACAYYGSAAPEATGSLISRVIGVVEGAEVHRRDPDTAALVVAALTLVEIGSGPEAGFSFDSLGDALVQEIGAVAPPEVDAHAPAVLAAVVAANAAFERAVRADMAELHTEALSEFTAARESFTEAGLGVESAICLRHQASLRAETDPEQALGDFAEARSVLAGSGRPVEVALADLHAALVVAEHVDVATAREMVNEARAVLGGHGLALEAATCEAVLAGLAKIEGRRLLAAQHFGTAADRFDDQGDHARAAQCRAEQRRLRGSDV